MSFRNFGKRKKTKNPVVSHPACTTGFLRLLYQNPEILLLVLHSLHDNLDVITTLQDDILQEV